MTTLIRNRNRQITYEDLRGLRARGYIRDSTPDQRNGFGPDIQRHNEERFAQSYGLILDSRWYTEFVSGRSVKKRYEFQSFIQDARLDQFDVLLVDHTSRFGRNQSDCRKYKDELQSLGKIVVFVSQGIISGSDRDFLSERINETLDEQYSRNLSRYIAEGLSEKAGDGLANGKPPLGYKSEKGDRGKPERKVPDFDGIGGDPKKGGMEALLVLLREYSSGRYSFESLGEHLTASGYRTRLGGPFTKGSVETVIRNRFYEGKVVFHPGKTDEKTLDGTHEVSDEVKELWLRCQQVRRQRANQTEGRPRLRDRAYLFSKVALCDQCGRHYGGQPSQRNSGRVIRRLCHSRPFCELRPHSVRVENLAAQFQEGVLPYISLDSAWKSTVLATLQRGKETSVDGKFRTKIQQALKNLRKQHLWGDIDDEEYRQEKRELERQVNAIPSPIIPADFVNLDRAAELLSDLPSLWTHRGVSDEQRESLIKEVFQEMRLRGNFLVAIKPKPEYQPLFAYIVTEGVRKYRGERI